ncbi:MAG: Na/Pi cotransporter family protein, partial [Alphaproteobacteria bacterium]|nr:Na/Pi cotransporter family protein [Alphaproteobacteria bacterium]
ANIGTTITAIIGAISANHQGKRLAGAHLIFNVITGVVAIAFIHQLTWAVDAVAAGSGISADDYTLKLAVFHTIFNVIGVVIMAPLTGRLVEFLERAVPAPREDLAQPQFLNEAVVEFPETLLEAVRNEAIHLYDNAMEILAHGLSLHRHHIHSDVDLEEWTRKDRTVFEFDLDTIYMRKVKVLFAAIVEYISRIQNQLPPEYANDIYELRKACGDIVQGVKDVKHLRKNMSLYVKSDNEDIRREYNRLRVVLGQMMRTVDLVRQDGDFDALDLDDFKLAMESDNAAANGTLDALIRDRRITAVMATSLMNDIDYARDLVWNLSEVGAVLFGARDQEDRAAEMLIALDQDDIEDMASDGAK